MFHLVHFLQYFAICNYSFNNMYAVNATDLHILFFWSYKIYCQPGDKEKDPPILISFGGSSVVEDKFLPNGKPENDDR